jgi:hypothetical protein
VIAGERYQHGQPLAAKSFSQVFSPALFNRLNPDFAVEIVVRGKKAIKTGV